MHILYLGAFGWVVDSFILAAKKYQQFSNISTYK